MAARASTSRPSARPTGGKPVPAPDGVVHSPVSWCARGAYRPPLREPLCMAVCFRWDGTSAFDWKASVGFGGRAASRALQLFGREAPVPCPVLCAREFCSNEIGKATPNAPTRPSARTARCAERSRPHAKGLVWTSLRPGRRSRAPLCASRRLFTNLPRSRRAQGLLPAWLRCAPVRSSANRPPFCDCSVPLSLAGAAPRRRLPHVGLWNICAGASVWHSREARVH